MPTQKDLKRLVRARMHRTGEAYTAARSNILNKKSKPDSAIVPVAADIAPAPTPEKPDYAALAGMSDEKIKEKTGCTWEKWVYALDRKKAYDLPHGELAELIKTKYKTPDWWTQQVAVGYERIKGLRVKGQRRNGTFSASKSKTYNVPVETLFEAWTDAKIRKRWLGDDTVKIRKATSPKSIRLEQDGSIIAVLFTKRGPAKSSVSIDEEKLPSKEAAVAVREYWTEKLGRLAEVLAS